MRDFKKGGVAGVGVLGGEEVEDCVQDYGGHYMDEEGDDFVTIIRTERKVEGEGGVQGMED